MGYAAIYPEDVIAHHRAFIARRRAERPSEEYRDLTAQEWDEFLAHFELRKVALGTCGRDHGTPCAHENACVRCRRPGSDAAAGRDPRQPHRPAAGSQGAGLAGRGRRDRDHHRRSDAETRCHARVDRSALHHEPGHAPLPPDGREVELRNLSPAIARARSTDVRMDVILEEAILVEWVDRTRPRPMGDQPPERAAAKEALARLVEADGGRDDAKNSCYEAFAGLWRDTPGNTSRTKILEDYRLSAPPPWSPEAAPRSFRLSSCVRGCKGWRRSVRSPRWRPCGG